MTVSLFLPQSPCLCPLPPRTMLCLQVNNWMTKMICKVIFPGLSSIHFTRMTAPAKRKRSNRLIKK